MNKIAISLLSGAGACALLGIVYVVAGYAGAPVPLGTLVAMAAFLAFGASVSVLIFSALTLPSKKVLPNQIARGRVAKLDRAFFTAFDGVKLVFKEDVRIDLVDSVNRDDKVAVVFRRTSDKSNFNPIPIKDVFARLKENGNFLHVILMNHENEFAGYVPGYYARTTLTGNNAESLIKQYIIDALDDPNKSVALRDIRGFAAADCISDEVSVSDAMKRMSAGLQRGLVVLHAGRHRKPTGIIYMDDLVRATAG